MSLPTTYKPEQLRKDKAPDPTIQYTVHKLEGSEPAIAGPFKFLENALEVVPNTVDEVVIYKHKGMSSSILYGWSHAHSCWFLLDHS